MLAKGNDKTRFSISPFGLQLTCIKGNVCFSTLTTNIAGVIDKATYSNLNDIVKYEVAYKIRLKMTTRHVMHHVPVQAVAGKRASFVVTTPDHNADSGLPTFAEVNTLSREI